ncbi:MAG: hypothetical protein ACI8PT_000262, partial [Gammaproteobacteria bacterium]
MQTEAETIRWLASVLRGEAPAWPTSPWDADSVWSIANENGVLELCYHHLADTAQWPAFPESWRADLTNLARFQAAQELVQLRELRAILEIASQEALSPLLLKGTALAYRIYPAAHLRPRLDHDILLPQQCSAERLAHRLRDRGYQRPNAIDGTHISQQSTYVKPGLPTHRIDLHWRISNSRYFAAALAHEELVRDAIPLAQISPHAKGLSPCHALMHACLHRIGHAHEGLANRLIWLYDIHLLATELGPSGLRTFASAAVNAKVAALCLDGLCASREHFLTDLPEPLEKELRSASKREDVSAQTFRTRLGVELLQARG